MKRACWFAGLIAGSSLFGTMASASDALTTAPTVYRKLMENHRVRVLEATFKPNDKVATHEQGEHMFYVLTDGNLVIEVPGKTGYEMTFKAGESFWLPAQTRALENDGKTVIKALIVEVKGAGSAIAAPASAGRRSAARSGRSAVRSGRVVFQQRPRRR